MEMIKDPLMPHLMDILASPDLGGLILAGGFGIRVKQDYLARIGTPTLITPIPPARATGDLDLFLRMEIFTSKDTQENARNAIDDLGYEPQQRNWQFVKPLGSNYVGRDVTLDLLSRHPTEKEKVRLDPPRVGKGLLHGRDTEEAFAIDMDPIMINLRDVTTTGQTIDATVCVPHPYAWINMKIRAAHDWLRMTRGEIPYKNYSEKHAYDVYALVAMLQEPELIRSAEIANQFADHPMAAAIREEAKELFSTPTSPGSLEVREQIGEELVFDSFDEALRTVLMA